MPAKASELERVAQKLGFEKVRQKDSHALGNIQMDEQPQFLYMEMLKF